MPSFRIVFSFLILVLSFQPSIFWIYYKRHSEKTKAIEPQYTRNKVFRRIWMAVLGLSISAVYFIGFSVGSSLLYTNTIVYSVFGCVCGMGLATLSMYLLSTSLDNFSRSSFFISSIVFFILLAIDFLIPTLIFPEPLPNSSTFHVISFVVLTLIALWLNHHSFKASARNSNSTVSTEPAAKIDLTNGGDSSTNNSNGKLFSTNKVTDVCSDSISATPEKVPHPSATPPLNCSTSLSEHLKYSFVKWLILSSALFCLIGITIGYLIGGGYFSPSLVPDSPYIQQLKKAESDASSNGYKKGYHNGRDDGYIAGKEYGYKEGYREGYDEGASYELALLLDDYLG